MLIDVGRQPKFKMTAIIQEMEITFERKYIALRFQLLGNAGQGYDTLPSVARLPKFKMAATET